MSQDIRFIRKNGRVIPIRDSKGGGSKGAGSKASKQPSSRRRQQQVGAGQMAAGAATAVGAGLGASMITRAAATLRKRASFQFDQTRRISRVLKGGGPGADFLKSKGGSMKRVTAAKDSAVIQRASSKVLRNLRRPAMFAGAAVAAGLMYKGAQNLGGERAKSNTLATAGVAGGVAAGAASAAYYRGLGLRGGAAMRYAAGLRTGSLAKKPKIPVKTRYGTLFDTRKR